MKITTSSLQKIFTSKSNTKTIVLKDVSLSIEQGEFVAIQGKSGAGKTTLLSIIGCLDRQTGGDYYIDNNNTMLFTNTDRAKLRNKSFGFVMQDYALINDDTVMDNIILPAVFAKNSVRNARKKAEELLKQFGIHKLSSKKVSGFFCLPPCLLMVRSRISRGSGTVMPRL